MKLSSIAELIGCQIPDEIYEQEIEQIASLHSANEKCISFLSDSRLADTACETKAGVVIVQKGTVIKGKICLEVDDPYVAYAKIALQFENTAPVWGEGVHESAIIDQSAHLDTQITIGPYSVIGSECRIGKNTIIGAHCTIEAGTTIGESCRIDSGVVIRPNMHIGSRVIIQANSVIGSDGFANANEKGEFIRIPCFGNVIIEDDVHIGACVTIDRGNFEPTVVCKGVKLDNLVHIAHNVTVGAHSALAALVGISGSTSIGKHVLVGGQAGFVGHVNVGNNSFIGAKAGVSKSIPPGSKVVGYPARELMKVRRTEAALGHLPELLKEVKRLRKELNTLKDIKQKDV